MKANAFFDQRVIPIIDAEFGKDHWDGKVLEHHAGENSFGFHLCPHGVPREQFDRLWLCVSEALDKVFLEISHLTIRMIRHGQNCCVTFQTVRAA